MKPSLRVVDRLPLSEIWDASGVLEHKRGRALGVSEIRELLRTSTLSFVVAEVGEPLSWISGDVVFRFWKDEAQSRIVPTRAHEGFRLAEFPGEYAYVAFEWTAESQPPVVVLECHH